MKKIYIASPYSHGDMALNVKRQMDMMNVLMNTLFLPFAPMLIHFQHMMHPRPYEEWLSWGLSWLEQCDCVLRLDGESAGADREVAHAISRGIPVAYSLEELYILNGKPPSQK